MKTTLYRFLAVVLATSTASLALAQGAFRLGIAPHTSARVIVEMYQPLRQHLEKALGTPVEIVTAPDFTEFARRAMAQEYDIAVTTGHQARMLQVDAGYAPLVTYAASFRAVALVAGTSPARTAADLKNTTVFGLSRTSLVTLWGQHWIKDNAVPGVTMEYVSASDSVARLLLAGKGAAGFVSLANYQQLAPPIQAQVRILAQSEPMAGRVYVLNRRKASDLARVDAALRDFGASEAGKAYFAKYRLDGYRKLTAREFEAMDPFADEVRQELKGAGK